MSTASLILSFVIPTLCANLAICANHGFVTVCGNALIRFVPANITSSRVAGVPPLYIETLAVSFTFSKSAILVTRVGHLESEFDGLSNVVD